MIEEEREWKRERGGERVRGRVTLGGRHFCHGTLTDRQGR